MLTGQDGFSPDQARGFAPTPQDVPVRRLRHRERRSALHRRPGTVPKAMDVLTPAGVDQADELDYTLHAPVTIQGVVIP